jgi:hypothetical protein
VRDLDRAALQRLVDWLRRGAAAGCANRSVANALTPLWLALDAAAAEGLLE